MQSHEKVETASDRTTRLTRRSRLDDRTSMRTRRPSQSILTVPLGEAYSGGEALQEGRNMTSLHLHDVDRSQSQSIQVDPLLQIPHGHPSTSLIPMPCRLVSSNRIDGLRVRSMRRKPSSAQKAARRGDQAYDLGWTEQKVEDPIDPRFRARWGLYQSKDYSRRPNLRYWRKRVVYDHGPMRPSLKTLRNRSTIRIRIFPLMNRFRNPYSHPLTYLLDPNFPVDLVQAIRS